MRRDEFEERLRLARGRNGKPSAWLYLWHVPEKLMERDVTVAMVTRDMKQAPYYVDWIVRTLGVMYRCDRPGDVRITPSRVNINGGGTLVVLTPNIDSLDGFRFDFITRTDFL